MTATAATRAATRQRHPDPRVRNGRPHADPRVLTARQRASYRTLRICPPERAAEVYALSLAHPELLPRMHQDDRGLPHAGLHHVAPPGAYASIPCWQSRTHWLTTTVPAALTVYRDVLRKHGVSTDMMMRWAIAKSAYASHRTGRQCIVRPLTLASVLGVTPGHVKKLNACGRELGLEVVVLKGRKFNLQERDQARLSGSRQTGLATETALTIPDDLRRRTADMLAELARLTGGIAAAALAGPQAALFPPRGVQRPLPVSSDTPLRGRLSNQLSPDSSTQHHGLTAEKKVAAPPRRPRKSDPGRNRVRRVAVELCQRISWLSSVPPGRITPAINRFVTAPELPWTADQLIAALNGKMWRARHGLKDGTDIAHRPAYLAALLRTIDPLADHPDVGPLVAALDNSCGHPGCDGSGWLTTTRPDGTPVAAGRCPSCGPRQAALPRLLTTPNDTPTLDDPPF